MKYLCLIYYDEQKLGNLPEAERDALYAEAYAYYDELVRSGYGLAGDPLRSVNTATTVRPQGGKVSITDGPYVETKEQLGGYILLEAHDLDEAIRLAARIPPARLGGVEVRPIRDMRPTPTRHGSGNGRLVPASRQPAGQDPGQAVSKQPTGRRLSGDE
ncbi:MAG: YciI family protein [Anaerolineae bacterium]|nr:YciI family protein [Anaerolineae bacterium]